MRGKLKSCTILTPSAENLLKSFKRATYIQVDPDELSGLVETGRIEMIEKIGKDFVFPGEYGLFIEDEYQNMGDLISRSAATDEIDHLMLIQNIELTKRFLAIDTPAPVVIGLDFRLEYEPISETERLYYQLKAKWPNVPIIAISQFEENGDADHVRIKKLIRSYGDSVYDKRQIWAAFSNIVRDKIAIHKLRDENEQLKSMLDAKDDAIADLVNAYEVSPLFERLEKKLIGKSPLMKNIKFYIDLYAKNDKPVSLYGETGTGKEVVAHAIHRFSKRRNGTMVIVNCAAIPAELLESELFGFEKGAHATATFTKKGKIEEANDGTLFLDEIGEMDMLLQTKLLRVLDEKKVTRLGANKPIDVNFRIITATNRNLKQAITENRFRPDLFRRIDSPFPEIPPLRERTEDIPLLVEHFLKMEGSDLIITNEAMKLLKQDPWVLNIGGIERLVSNLTIIFGTRKDRQIGIREVRPFLDQQLKVAQTGQDPAGAPPVSAAAEAQAPDCAGAKIFLNKIEQVLVAQFDTMPKVSQEKLIEFFPAKTKTGINRDDFIKEYFAPHRACIKKMLLDEANWLWPLAKQKCQFIRNA